MIDKDLPLLHIYHSDDFEDIIDRLTDLLERHFSISLQEIDDPNAPPSCHTTYFLESIEDPFLGEEDNDQ